MAHRTRLALFHGSSRSRHRCPAFSGEVDCTYNGQVGALPRRWPLAVLATTVRRHGGHTAGRLAAGTRRGRADASSAGHFGYVVGLRFEPAVAYWPGRGASLESSGVFMTSSSRTPAGHARRGVRGLRHRAIHCGLVEPPAGSAACDGGCRRAGFRCWPMRARVRSQCRDLV
jgi:hypothetical protein